MLCSEISECNHYKHEKAAISKQRPWLKWVIVHPTPLINIPGEQKPTQNSKDSLEEWNFPNFPFSKISISKIFHFGRMESQGRYATAIPYLKYLLSPMAFKIEN